MYVKIRVGFDKELREFNSKREAFEWVKTNVSPPETISLLTYDHGGLEALDRYHFNGEHFYKENITS